MGIEALLNARPEALVCPAGHDHAQVHVWASIQQQGVYSRKRLPTFHCGNHDVRGRGENWRQYPIALAIEQDHVLPCKICLPALAAYWRELMDQWRRQSRQ